MIDRQKLIALIDAELERQARECGAWYGGTLGVSTVYDGEISPDQIADAVLKELEADK